MGKLDDRIAAAIDAELKRGVVAPLDLLGRIGWVHRGHEDAWRQGRAASLEAALAFPPNKLVDAITIIRSLCTARELTALEGTYVAATRERAPLRFTSAGGDNVERAWRTHWVSPALSEKKRANLAMRAVKAPDILVHLSLRAGPCAECDRELAKGDEVLLERDAMVCLACAGLDHLVVLPRGDVALTRRARAESKLAAIVMLFSRTRGRSERQGILIEEDALARAEAHCLADADARERQRARDAERRAREDVDLVKRMTDAIVALFPRCPVDEAAQIARHAAERSSGRVGRSAAGRELDERALALAVGAHVRHVHTDYDALLMSGVEREAARERIRDDVARVLASWRSGKI